MRRGGNKIVFRKNVLEARQNLKTFLFIIPFFFKGGRPCSGGALGLLPERPATCFLRGWTGKDRGPPSLCPCLGFSLGLLYFSLCQLETKLGKKVRSSWCCLWGKW